MDSVHILTTHTAMTSMVPGYIIHAIMVSGVLALFGDAHSNLFLMSPLGESKTLAHALHVSINQPHL